MWGVGSTTLVFQTFKPGSPVASHPTKARGIRCCLLHKHRCHLQADRPCRHLQNHQRIERGDAVVAADICIRVPVAAGCDIERDCGICGGGGVVPFLSILDRAVKRAMVVEASVT